VTERVRLEASGLFVLRTPALPFDDLLRWAGTGWRDGDAKDVLERETQRLGELVQRPEVREALFLESPLLVASVEALSRGGRVEPKAARALVGYLMRMTTRPVPNGLMAGYTVGTRLGASTRLDLPPRSGYRRRTSFSVQAVTSYALAAVGEATPRHRLNSTARLSGNAVVFHALEGPYVAYQSMPSRTPASTCVAELMALACEGASVEELVAGLRAGGVAEQDARSVVDDAVATGLLVPDTLMPLTTRDPLGDVCRALRAAGATAAADRLTDSAAQLAVLDADGVGLSLERYRAVIETAGCHDVDPNACPLRVELAKPQPDAGLGKTVLDEIEQGIAVLLAVTPRTPSPLIDRFMEAFVTRYEAGAEVPFLDLFDPHTGLDLDETGPRDPLLAGLPADASPKPGRQWTARDAVLLRLVQHAVASRSEEIELPAEELARETSPWSMPPSLEAVVRIAATSVEVVDTGDFRILLSRVCGPPGYRYLGRLTTGDRELERLLHAHVTSEEAQHPEAVFAEIVHLPATLFGDILTRAPMRRHEITYGAGASAAGAVQLPASDLMVTVRSGRVRLRSRSLGREVLPRVGISFRPELARLPAYRMLAALDSQDGFDKLAWDWGAIGDAPFLPRVVSGRTVLSRRTWNVTPSDVGSVPWRRAAHDSTAACALLGLLRDKLGVPRHVSLVEDENDLGLDLDLALTAGVIARDMARNGVARLAELFPPPDQLCVRGPEGAYLHDLVIPFTRPSGASTAVPALQLPGPRASQPGAEWLYLKIYCSPFFSDRILTDVLRPFLHDPRTSEGVDTWFFIRYADPEHHLRLRLHGAPAFLARLLPDLHAALVPSVAGGTVFRTQLDTYVAEVDRYGGEATLPVAERVFGLDSAMVVDVLAATTGREEQRWRVAVVTFDAMLSALGLSATDKVTWAKQRVRELARQIELGDADLDRLLQRCREQQPEATRALVGGGVDDDLWPGRMGRRAAMQADLEQIARLADEGRTTRPIGEVAGALTHMHANRMFHFDVKKQELMVCRMLEGHHRSQLARGR